MGGRVSQRLRVLVVDDDPDHRFILAEVLKRNYGDSVDVVPAGSISGAVAALRESSPDCIVLDLSLPDARGVAGVEELRRESDSAIVVVSGREDLGVNALVAGAQDYLSKDGAYEGDGLRAAIDRAIERHAAVQEQAYLAAIVESASEAMFVRALDGTILTWNAAAEKIYGYSRDEIVGKHFFTLVPTGRRQTEIKITELLAEGRPVPPYEAVRVRKDGTLIDVAVANAAITDQRGSVVGISHIAREITDEKVLRKERDLLAGLVNSSIGAIVSFDPDGVITSWNRGAERLFGYTAAEAVGHMTTFLAPDERQSESRGLLEQLLVGGEIEDFETVRQTKDGRLVDVILSASPVTGRNGKLLGVVGMYHDITERKQLEEQLLQSQKMEALGGLAGGMAHDFNNLLAVILNYGRFIESDLPEDHPARQDAKELIGAAERGASLVRQLLSFARREVIRPEPMNLNLLVAQMEPLLKRATNEDIELETKLDDDLWNTEADRGQIEQLLLNLVVNARDAMPSGGKVVIETRNIDADEAFVSSRRDMEPGRYVSLSVSDTGVGMNRETASRIFEPFFTTKPRGSGTGLGLASAYGIVQRAGGDISVYSEPGIGTTFKIYFPAADAPAFAISRRIHMPGSTKGNGERVLVVEDEQEVLSLISRILIESGYVPVAVESPQIAVEELRDGHVDLLLTDMIMPEMSGRALAQLTDVPTVFMSGYTDTIVAEQGVLQEGVVFLPKPFSAAELLNVVRTTLDQHMHVDLTGAQRSAS